MDSFALVGTVVDTTDDWKLNVEEKCLIVVDETGKIALKGENTKENLDNTKESFGLTEDDIIYMEEKDEFLLPGFIDSHFHASQFPNCGLGLDLPLLGWLEKYAFPLEKRFEDTDFARKVYESAVSSTLNGGTTTATYFATIHRPATEILCDVALEKGQRALVGKVCMNRFGNGYQESTSNSLKETELFVTNTLQRRSHLVQPVITPRFAPTCDEELLTGLGHLAEKYNVRIQSHLSENTDEIKWVSELFPSSKSYTDVYKNANLLTNKTLMAHGVYLSQEELDMMRDAGTGISHCPNSNVSIKSGLCDVLRLKANGVDVGLGTDCSGGYSTSMLDAMRLAIATSNIIHFQNPQKQSCPLTFEGALYLATRGSAKICSLDNMTGKFDVGFQFDALRIKMNERRKETTLFGHESISDMIQKFVFVGDDRNIIQIYVGGKTVKGCVSSDDNKRVFSR